MNELAQEHHCAVSRMLEASLGALELAQGQHAAALGDIEALRDGVSARGLGIRLRTWRRERAIRCVWIMVLVGGDGAGDVLVARWGGGGGLEGGKGRGQLQSGEGAGVDGCNGAGEDIGWVQWSRWENSDIGTQAGRCEK